MGVLTTMDRAALAAYCQAYGRWVEAEERLRETPMLFKTPSGYVQQSPWLGIANKQLEIMGRYMVELGMTPAARSRLAANSSVTPYCVAKEPIRIERTCAVMKCTPPSLSGMQPESAKDCGRFSKKEQEQ